MAMSVRVLSMFYGSVLLTKDSGEQFMVKLRATLGEAFKDFEALDNSERASFVLHVGCELRMENFDRISPLFPHSLALHHRGKLAQKSQTLHTCMYI